MNKIKTTIENYSKTKMQMNYKLYLKIFFNILNNIVKVAAILLSIYHIYIAVTGVSSTIELRAIHLMVLLAIGIINIPLCKKEIADKNVFKSITVFIFNVILIFFAIGANINLMTRWANRIFTYGGISILDLFLGVGLIVVILEAARRIVSPALSLTALFFLLYTIFGHLIVGYWGHRYYTFERIITFLYTSMEGIYGIPLGLSATVIVLFIIFGAFLQKTGGTTFFVDFAKAMVGHHRGGPAKAAIISSAFVGTMSGSPVANVVATGTFTIPLMIKAGYKKRIAGAVEAVASTGGLMVPPIMGASAFLMAEYLEIPYFKVAVIGILPALLYYLALFVNIDIESQKLNLKGIPKKLLAPKLKILAQGGHLILVIVFLFVFLAMGWTPTKAVVFSLAILLILSFLKKETRLSIRSFLEALEDGAKGTVLIAVSTSCAGIIVGCILLTGLGTKFSNFIYSLSGTYDVLCLITAAIATLILGFAMPPTPVYILMAVLIIPSLSEVGFNVIACHFFIFYFSAIAGLTPPVAITSYTAASVASGSDPTKVSILAFKYALTAFILPFMFMYSPELLLQGEFFKIITASATSIIGIITFVIGVQGYLYKKLSYISRLFFIISSFLLVKSGIQTDIFGLGLIFITATIHYLNIKRERK